MTAPTELQKDVMVVNLAQATTLVTGLNRTGAQRKGTRGVSMGTRWTGEDVSRVR